MFLSKLPTEISNRILGYLPRKTQLQCLVVCKSWYKLALSKLTRNIQIQSGREIISLSKCLDTNRVNGNEIRVLSLSVLPYPGFSNHLRESVVHVLAKCTNIQVLYLGWNSNQILECMYQNGRALQLESLKAIYAPFHLNLESQYHDMCIHRDRDYNSIYPYCHKIIQISLDVNDHDYIYGPDNLDFRTFLSCFVHVKKLSIALNNNLAFDDIISACPALETLQLVYSGDSLEFKPATYRTEAHAKTPIKCQLKTLAICTEFLSYELLEYLADNCTQLYQLTLKWTESHIQNSFNSINETAKRPPIRRLQFMNSLKLTTDLVAYYTNFFHKSLKMLDLVNCQLISPNFQPNNAILNLSGLELERISIDTGAFRGSPFGFNKMALEVTLKDQETKFFKHEWEPGHVFERKTTRQYTCNANRERRIDSHYIWLLSITADSIQHLFLYNGKYQHPVYQQTIDLSS